MSTVEYDVQRPAVAKDMLHYDWLAEIARNKIDRAIAQHGVGGRSVEEVVELAILGFDVGEDETFAEMLARRDQDRPQEHQKDKVIEVVGGLVGTFMEPRREGDITQRVADGFGIMLIRPEVLHIADDIVEEVSLGGIAQVIDRRRLTITAQQYVSIYSHVFSDPKKERHVRRRAFGYVDTELEAVLMRSTTPDEVGGDFMDLFTERHKGTAGLHDGTTLRGGTVHRNISASLSADRARVLSALDPLGLYERPTWDNSYAQGVDTLLANLPGVHIPDSTEVVKDMSIIFDDWLFPPVRKVR